MDTMKDMMTESKEWDTDTNMIAPESLTNTSKAMPKVAERGSQRVGKILMHLEIDVYINYIS